MISAGDFRNGVTIELDNNVYQIIEFQHVKPGTAASSSGPSVRPRNAPRHASTERICSICTTMVTFTTLWILRAMSRSHLVPIW